MKRRRIHVAEPEPSEDGALAAAYERLRRTDEPVDPPWPDEKDQDPSS